MKLEKNKIEIEQMLNTYTNGAVIVSVNEHCTSIGNENKENNVSIKHLMFQKDAFVNVDTLDNFSHEMAIKLIDDTIHEYMEEKPNGTFVTTLSVCLNENSYSVFGVLDTNQINGLLKLGVNAIFHMSLNMINELVLHFIKTEFTKK